MFWVRYNPDKSSWEASSDDGKTFYDLTENNWRAILFGQWFDILGYTDDKAPGPIRIARPAETIREVVGLARFGRFLGNEIKDVIERLGRSELVKPPRIVHVPPVSPASTARIYYNKDSKQIEGSVDGSSYFRLFGPIGDPLEVGDIITWLQADAIVGLNDGDAITTWEDSSPNNNDATQGTAANKPIYKVSILNGKPVVRFDGSNDYMQTPVFTPNLAASTIFVVGKVNGVAAQQFFTDGTTGTTRNIIFINTSSFAIHSGTTLLDGAADTSFHIFSALFTASASSKLFKDGTLVISGNSGTQALNQLRIGIDTAGGNPLAGDIAELIVYRGILTDTERKRIESYLSAKYGITVAP